MVEVMIMSVHVGSNCSEAILNKIDALKELGSLEDISHHVMQSRNKGCAWTGKMVLGD